MNAKKVARKQRRDDSKYSTAIVKSALSALMKYTVDLAQEEGASTWLTLWRSLVSHSTRVPSGMPWP